MRHNNITEEAIELYKKLAFYFNENNSSGKNKILENRQNEIPKQFFWTRYSNSSDPLPPIRND